MTVPISQLVRIEKPIYGGAFLARLEGKAVFVPLALPGEEARVRIVDNKKGYATAEVEEIVSASPERIAPRCPYFGPCGGCNYQHAGYETQLAFKQAILRETFARAGVELSGEISVLAGDPWAYRNRVRLAFDSAGSPGYRGRRSHAVIPITQCPIAAPSLIEVALAFAEIRRNLAPALRVGELSLFSNADESEILASISIPHRTKLDLARVGGSLRERVPALTGIELMLESQGRDQAATLARWGAESLVYHAAGMGYRVDHGAFFQVNRWLVDPLVGQVTAGHTGGLAWDLFAGVGLFARRLAAGFNHVIAVESAPTAIAALKANLSGTAAEAVALPALDFLRRNRAASPDLIVIDPPRSGLGAETTDQLSAIAAPAIVYVSCDPATLARDLRALTAAGYILHAITLADLFPQTFHLETIVELRHA
ncbi:MAG: 23S rRNA (uracil(1939)-C(5))-methyltransferase RlmD [Terracidiphilus sp.]